MEVREEVACPACGENILASAKKCKHCGEWVATRTPSAHATRPPASSPNVTGKAVEPETVEALSPRDGRRDDIADRGTGGRSTIGVPVAVEVNGLTAFLTANFLEIQESSVGALVSNAETYNLGDIRGIGTTLDEATQKKKEQLVTSLGVLKWLVPLYCLIPLGTGALGLVLKKGAVKTLMMFALGAGFPGMGVFGKYYNKKQLEALRPMRLRVRLSGAVREFSLPNDAQSVKAVNDFVADVQRVLLDREQMTNERVKNAPRGSRQPDGVAAVSSDGESPPIMTDEQRRQIEVLMLESQKQLAAAQNGDITSTVLLAIAGVVLLFSLVSVFSSPSTSGASYERSQAEEQERVRNSENARIRARVACGQEAFVGATKAQTERCLDRADRIQ